jgi:putative endonuclease
LKLLDRNFRQKAGELDIIMEDGNCIVFVEVRYRASNRYGDGLASVTRPKQRRMIRAASAYLARHKNLAVWPCRFDVIAISGAKTTPVIRWVANAFS